MNLKVLCVQQAWNWKRIVIVKIICHCMFLFSGYVSHADTNYRNGPPAFCNVFEMPYTRDKIKVLRAR